MKKAIVLLISLFFIIALSILILVNIADTEKYVQEENFLINNAQVMISIKNTKDEIAKLLSKNEKDINDLLEQNEKPSLSIKLENVDIKTTLKKYEYANINDLHESSLKSIRDIFDENNIPDFENFKDIFLEKFPKKENTLNSLAQLKDVIHTFVLETNSQNKKIIEEKIAFLNNDKLYELYVKVDYNNTFTKAYYVLNNKGEVKYFDLSIK